MEKSVIIVNIFKKYSSEINILEIKLLKLSWQQIILEHLKMILLSFFNFIK